MNTSQTTPGTIVNQVSITILDEQNQVVTGNYTISFDLGTLTVNSRELGISTPSASGCSVSALAATCWRISPVTAPRKQNCRISAS
jgi:hypothetical protein